MKIIGRYWLLALTGALLILAGAAYRDYGISWDERVQSEYGERALDYYLSAGADKSYLKVGNLRYYGPLFEIISAMAYSGKDEAKYQIRHMTSAVMGIFAVAGAAVFAGLIASRAGAFLAAISLALTPVFYGHWYINSKDIPFAAMFAWSMALLARFIQPGGATWKNALLGGLMMGLASAIRPAGAPLLFLMAALAVGYSIALGRMAGVRGNHDADMRSWREMALKAVIMPALAMVILAAAWPWAHEGLFNIAGGMLEGMRFKVAYPTLFNGQTVMSHQLPRSYILHYYAVTAPPALMALAMAGAGLGVITLFRDPSSAESSGIFILLAWFFTPILFFMSAGANIYDGLRHFLFIMPAVSIMAGYGAHRLLKPAGARGGAVIFGFLLAALSAPAWEMARLHPYQYAYFNFIAGGAGGASGRYETDYWATSYKEAMEKIAVDAGLRSLGHARVLTAGNSFNKDCALRFAGSNITVETTEEKFGAMVPPKELSQGDLPEGYDYYLASYRYGMAEAFPKANTLFVIGRAGAVFAVVKGPGG